MLSLKSKLSVIAAVATALVLVPAMAFAQEVGANKWEQNKWLAASAGFALVLAGWVAGASAGGNPLRRSAAATAGTRGSRSPGAILSPVGIGVGCWPAAAWR